MKHALPILLKYIAFVAATCFLAYFISHNFAVAQAVLPTGNASAGDGKRFAEGGVYQTETSLGVWKDATRIREIPVKLYFPTSAQAKTAISKFPVILFSHGLGGNREGGKRWAGHWASHGFVVVVMQHVGSDEGLWKVSDPSNVVRKMQAGLTLNNLLLRVQDVHFVIDDINRRIRVGDAGFANADAQRIGMSGHSFGAQTTLAVVGQRGPTTDLQPGLDSRISAAVAFSPNARNKSALTRQFGSIKIPLFSITGGEDGSILDDGTKVDHRRLPFDNMPHGQKYLAVFEDGDHMVFGGHGFGQRRAETARDKQIQLDVMAGTLAFWRSTLYQDTVARSWLEQGGYKSAIGTCDVFEHK